MNVSTAAPQRLAPPARDAAPAPAPAAEATREPVDLFFDNSGRSKYENDYRVTRRLPDGSQISLFLDNQGRSDSENDYRVTADTPRGKVDFLVDNQGKTFAENDFAIRGNDVKGSFDLFVDNQGRTENENDYRITGTVYGESVNVFIDNTGKSAEENDFRISGDAPPGFLSSPFFSNFVLPSLATVPILNEAGNLKERIKGPLLLNYANSILSGIERQLQG